MTPASLVRVADVKFEHYRPLYTLGVDDLRPRISWKISGTNANSFRQEGYEIEVFKHIGSPKNNEGTGESRTLLGSARVVSNSARLVPWPLQQSLQPRERISVRLRAFSAEATTTWSDDAVYELGLVMRKNWHGERIVSSRLSEGSTSSPQETLYRRSFQIKTESPITRARLYLVVQGVYRVQLNGHEVSEDVLQPGWTVYNDRIRYQTYDVQDLLLQPGFNCVGISLADGWFCGRIGFMGGRRNRWGPYPTLLSQLEITYSNGSHQVICSDREWLARPGPAFKAELYDGERYDFNAETRGWSEAFSDQNSDDLGWEKVTVLSQLPDSVKFTAGHSEPVRPIEILKPVKLIKSPSGKNILDFGQNFAGFVRLTEIAGSKGHTITLRHAEVLEDGELALRPLRVCEAKDEFVFGDKATTSWEPRFTYHGFRYCQVDGLLEKDLLESVEGVACHNDFESVGEFSCSNTQLNQLYSNAKWSMRGNFFSIPTDCPQRDERLGWTGDIALFASTALKLYDCYGFLKDWMIDVVNDQNKRGGVPAYVTPDMFDDAGIWAKVLPVAVWHDAVILVPWALFEASGDIEILRLNYKNMKKWLEVIPRDDKYQRRLWSRDSFQLGDWLDPTARPEQPMDGQTDPLLVADAFLVHSLDLMSRIATILDIHEDARRFKFDVAATRQQFLDEYVTANGRLSSDSQTSYALAIVFDLLQTPHQTASAGARLATLIRRNGFKVGTGFAGTPFLCEALLRTGHYQVAYATLLCEDCPSWLYPITLGATTMWERWDSMLPNAKVNPGEMTSFNHYCFGTIVSFLCERLAGLQCIEPGWKSCRVAPQPGGDITFAQVKQRTPYGCVSVEWNLEKERFSMKVEIPPGVTAEIFLPSGTSGPVVVGGGQWSFDCDYQEDQAWPVEPIAAFPDLI